MQNCGGGRGDGCGGAGGEEAEGGLTRTCEKVGAGRRMNGEMGPTNLKLRMRRRIPAARNSTVKVKILIVNHEAGERIQTFFFLILSTLFLNFSYTKFEPSNDVDVC
jgi:hypothetical protein